MPRALKTVQKVTQEKSNPHPSGRRLGKLVEERGCEVFRGKGGESPPIFTFSNGTKWSEA